MDSPAHLVVFVVLSGLVVTGLGVITWLLRALRRQLGEQHVAAMKAADEVRQTFLLADDSFKRLIDTLRDIENLQQISQRVDQIGVAIVKVHEQIASQLEAARIIIDQLHKLVANWSNEGTELQRAYQTLARAVERALFIEAEGGARRE